MSSAPATCRTGEVGALAGRGPSQPSESWSIGHYLIEGEIGRGGLARVLRARHAHPRFGDQVFAIKVLHPELAGQAVERQRLLAEASLLVSLHHPNIVRTHEAGVDGDRVFIAMEWVPGLDLDQLVRRWRQRGSELPRSLLLHVFSALLEGLAHAHELTDDEGRRLNVVHRDLSPSNVLISEIGEVKLSDFGIAVWREWREKPSPLLLGKLGRFAPEQLSGSPIDQRADVFAFGVLMFELLVGRMPFGAGGQHEVMERNALAVLPERAFLPPDEAALEAIIRVAMARRPEQRYADARALRQALAPLLPEAQRCQQQLAERVAAVVEPGAGKRATPAAPPPRKGVPPRVLLVSRDKAAAGALALHLARQGLRVDVACHLAGVQRLLQRYSCRALVIDTLGLSGFEVAQLVGAVRAAPGIGLVPAVLVGAPPQAVRPPHCVTLPVDAAAEELAAALHQELSRCRGERAFVRFPLERALALTYRGCQYDGRLVNVSRGGAFIEAACAPPRDAEVQVRFAGWGAKSIVASARVAHVAPASADVSTFALGLEWTEQSGAGEAELISLIVACVTSGGDPRG